ncbi:MAG: hypothetical protein ACTTIM_06090 [Campylobacter sp.]
MAWKINGKFGDFVWAVLRATSGCELNLAVSRLAILLVVLCRSGREIYGYCAQKFDDG